MNDNAKVLTTFKQIDEYDDKPVRSASGEFDINNNSNNKQSPVIETRNVGNFKQIWQSNNPNSVDKTTLGNNSSLLISTQKFKYI
jgi:hypothetical protein